MLWSSRAHIGLFCARQPTITEPSTRAPIGGSRVVCGDRRAVRGGLYARRVARYFDVHPASPQPRAIAQIAGIVRAGGVIAYPTDSCYALGCQLGNKEGTTRIRSIRHLDDRHHLTLVCRDFAQLGQFVHVPNRVFRAVKAATPGSYTFILPAAKEVPRRLQHPGKKTVVEGPVFNFLLGLGGHLRFIVEQAYLEGYSAVR
jgi:hypothetical protein